MPQWKEGFCLETGNSEKEVKRRFQLWLKPSTLRLADKLFEDDNCASRSEFIEKAILFYAGYICAQDGKAYLSNVITSTLKGIVAESTNQIGKILFKLRIAPSAVPLPFGCKVTLLIQYQTEV